jgi:hypothetical protein
MSVFARLGDGMRNASVKTKTPSVEKARNAVNTERGRLPDGNRAMVAAMATAQSSSEPIRKRVRVEVTV